MPKDPNKNNQKPVDTQAAENNKKLDKKSEPLNKSASNNTEDDIEVDYDAIVNSVVTDTDPFNEFKGFNLSEAQERYMLEKTKEFSPKLKPAEEIYSKMGFRSKDEVMKKIQSLQSKKVPIPPRKEGEAQTSTEIESKLHNDEIRTKQQRVLNGYQNFIALQKGNLFKRANVQDDTEVAKLVNTPIDEVRNKLDNNANEYLKITEQQDNISPEKANKKFVTAKFISNKTGINIGSVLDNFDMYSQAMMNRENADIENTYKYVKGVYDPQTRLNSLQQAEFDTMWGGASYPNSMRKPYIEPSSPSQGPNVGETPTVGQSYYKLLRHYVGNVDAALVDVAGAGVKTALRGLTSETIMDLYNKGNPVIQGLQALPEGMGKAIYGKGLDNIEENNIDKMNEWESKGVTAISQLQKGLKDWFLTEQKYVENNSWSSSVGKALDGITYSGGLALGNWLGAAAGTQKAFKLAQSFNKMSKGGKFFKSLSNSTKLGRIINGGARNIKRTSKSVPVITNLLNKLGGTKGISKGITKSTVASVMNGLLVREVLNQQAYEREMVQGELTPEEEKQINDNVGATAFTESTTLNALPTGVNFLINGMSSGKAKWASRGLAIMLGMATEMEQEFREEEILKQARTNENMVHQLPFYHSFAIEALGSDEVSDEDKLLATTVAIMSGFGDATPALLDSKNEIDFEKGMKDIKESMENSPFRDEMYDENGDRLSDEEILKKYSIAKTEANSSNAQDTMQLIKAHDTALTGLLKKARNGDYGKDLSKIVEQYIGDGNKILKEKNLTTVDAQIKYLNKQNELVSPRKLKMEAQLKALQEKLTEQGYNPNKIPELQEAVDILNKPLGEINFNPAEGVNLKEFFRNVEKIEKVDQTRGIVKRNENGEIVRQEQDAYRKNVDEEGNITGSPNPPESILKEVFSIAQVKKSGEKALNALNNTLEASHQALKRFTNAPKNSVLLSPNEVTQAAIDLSKDIDFSVVHDDIMTAVKERLGEWSPEKQKYLNKELDSQVNKLATIADKFNIDVSKSKYEILDEIYTKYEQTRGKHGLADVARGTADQNTYDFVNALPKEIKDLFNDIYNLENSIQDYSESLQTTIGSNITREDLNAKYDKAYKEGRLQSQKEQVNAYEYAAEELTNRRIYNQMRKGELSSYERAARREMVDQIKNLPKRGKSRGLRLETETSGEPNVNNLLRELVQTVGEQLLSRNDLRGKGVENAIKYYQDLTNRADRLIHDKNIKSINDIPANDARAISTKLRSYKAMMNSNFLKHKQQLAKKLIEDGSKGHNELVAEKKKKGFAVSPFIDKNNKSISKKVWKNFKQVYKHTSPSLHNSWALLKWLDRQKNGVFTKYGFENFVNADEKYAMINQQLKKIEKSFGIDNIDRTNWHRPTEEVKLEDVEEGSSTYNETISPKISKQQMMTIYMYAQQEDGIRHLVNGRHEITYEQDGSSYTHNVKMSREQIQDIISRVENDKNMNTFTNYLRDSLDYLADEINDVSLRLNGYKLATIPNYFPIKVTQTALKELNEKTEHAIKTGNANSQQIEELLSAQVGQTPAMDVFKQRGVKSTKGLVIDNAETIFDRVVQKGELYSAYTEPAQDFKTILDYTPSGGKQNKQLVNDLWGNVFTKHIEGIGTAPFNKPTARWANIDSKIAEAWLVSSITVPAYQYLALISASYELESKYVAQASALAGKYTAQTLFDKLDQYRDVNPLLVERLEEAKATYQTGEAHAASTGSLADRSRKMFQTPLRHTDAAITIALFESMKNKARDNNPNATEAEINQAATKEYKRVVPRTQAYFARHHRTKLARSNSEIQRLIGIFTSETSQIASITADALREGKVNKNYGKMSKGMGILLANITAVAAMKELEDAAYNEAREAIFGIKNTSNVRDSYLNSILQNFLTVAVHPGASKVYSGARYGNLNIIPFASVVRKAQKMTTDISNFAENPNMENAWKLTDEATSKLLGNWFGGEDYYQWAKIGAGGIGNLMQEIPNDYNRLEHYQKVFKDHDPNNKVIQTIDMSNENKNNPADSLDLEDLSTEKDKEKEIQTIEL